MKEKRNTTGNITGGSPKPWKRILVALLTFAIVFQQMPAANIAQAAGEAAAPLDAEQGAPSNGNKSQVYLG